MNFKSLLVIPAAALMLTSANAEETVSKVEANVADLELSEGSNNDPLGWVPFAAVGISGFDFDETLAGEDGAGGNARVIGAYYNKARNFVFDLGLGFEGVDLNGREESSALAELAARYRLGNSKKWSVGPVANMNLGNDIGTDFGAAEDNIASFVGAQVIRDFAVGDKTIIRAGLKALTDVGIPNSTVNKYLFELQFGAMLNPTKVTETYEEEVAEAAPVVEEPVEIVEEVVIQKPAAAVEEIKAEVEKINLETFVAPTSVYFVTDKEGVGARNEKVVSKLSEILNKNSDLIEKVKVLGFADSRGAAAYNQKLSEGRAQTVVNNLKAAGIKLPLEAIGMGEIETGADLERARRVDIEIVGVKDENLLKELTELTFIK